MKFDLLNLHLVEKFVAQRMQERGVYDVYVGVCACACVRA